MIYHIVTGDVAAVPLKEAIAAEQSMAGNVVVIKDVLSLGPLQQPEGQKFSDVRTAFWQMIVPNEKSQILADDLERLLQAGNELSKNEENRIWIWVAPLPADICTYFWTMHYLRKYLGRVYVVNITGLPFLDEDKKIYYPQSIGNLSAAEVVKARKLARPVTNGELESDTDDWRRLMSENSGIRTYEGGKKIVSRNADIYDARLLAQCTDQYQKASRIISQTMAKSFIPTGDLYLGWRLRKIAETGVLSIQGDPSKSIKDFELRLNNGELVF